MMEMENYETEQATQIMQCKTVEIFLDVCFAAQACVD